MPDKSTQEAIEQLNVLLDLLESNGVVTSAVAQDVREIDNRPDAQDVKKKHNL